MNESDYEPQARRPIASRELAISRRMAGWLAQRQVSPNAISVAGMLAAILGGLAFWATSLDSSWSRWFWLGGAIAAQFRLLANMFDGMVAVLRNVASPLGELYNEVPDRVSDSALFIGLGYAAGGYPLLGFLAALAAVFTAYVRAAVKLAGAPQDYCGPMAKPQRMFVVTLLGVYCAAAPAAWQPVSTPQNFGLATLALFVVLLGSLATAGRRLMRGARYLRQSAS